MEGGEAREYVFQTYGHIAKRVLDLAAGFSTLSLSSYSKIGIFSVNRAEWIITEYACYANSYVTVPLYDTLGDEAIEYIVGQTEMQCAVVSMQKLPQLFKLRDKLPSLTTVVCMDSEVSDEMVVMAGLKNIRLIKFGELEQLGRQQADFTPSPAKPEDLCTICYTSGTTGKPKGVMLSHANVLAVSSGALALIGYNKLCPNPNPIAQLESPGEVYLSYLPLAHVMERAIIATLLTLGFKIGFFQGDVLKLMSDCEALRPTFFVSVPRLFNRVYDKVMAGVAAKGGFSKWLFDYAFETKLAALKQDGTLTHWLWDRLVFAPIREKLGGRVKAMLTGSAPLSAQVLDFMRVVFSCPVLEGFGMTETAAITTLTAPGDLTQGQIGVPTPCVEVKLVDIPEMNYTSKDEPNPRGEIWVRGSSVFSGYYKNEEATADSLKSDNWLATGDVGMWDARGRLYLIDRKKALFKLSQGEYVAPEKIEAVLCRQAKVAQAYVEGDSLKPFLIAIIVPDREHVLPWARSTFLHLASASWEEICAEPAVASAILQDLARLGSKGTGELKGFEMPKALHLEPELFSVENGMLTPKFSLKRAVAKKKYEAVIKNLYASVKE